MLQPSAQDLANGIMQFEPELYKAEWQYLIMEGQMYAINCANIDWDSDIEEWNPNEMGQWPFGNHLSEEEQIIEEAQGVLHGLECDLDYEIEWMDRIENQENGVYDDDDDDYDPITDDDGYETSEEVDFEAYDFWVFNLNPVLMRIQLYRDEEE